MTDRLGHLLQDTRLDLTLPLPPTDNRYYGKPRGLRHKYVTRSGRLFKHEVATLVWQAGGMGRFPNGRVAIRCVLHMPSNSDLGNRLKALGDALQDSQLIRDDVQIDQWHLYRGRSVRKGSCELTIWKLRNSMEITNVQMGNI